MSFSGEMIESDKVRDHCHLTGNYRRPAHSKCNIQVTQHKINFTLFVFHNFSNSDCHMFSKKALERKKDKVIFKLIPKSNEKIISVQYGCIRFIDSYRFLSSSWDTLVKTLNENSHKTLKDFGEKIVDNGEIFKIVIEIRILIKEDRYNNDSFEDIKKDCPDKIEKSEDALLNYMEENDLKILKTGFSYKWKFSTKKLAYPYDFFNSIKDYKKSVEILKKINFSKKLKNDYPSDKN